MSESDMFGAIRSASVIALILGLTIALAENRKARTKAAILAGLLPILSFWLCPLKASPKDALNLFALIGLMYWIPLSFVTMLPAFGVGWSLGYLGQAMCGHCRKNEISLKGMRRYGPPPLKASGQAKWRSVRTSYDPRWMPTESED